MLESLKGEVVKRHEVVLLWYLIAEMLPNDPASCIHTTVQPLPTQSMRAIEYGKNNNNAISEIRL